MTHQTCPQLFYYRHQWSTIAAPTLFELVLGKSLGKYRELLSWTAASSANITHNNFCHIIQIIPKNMIIRCTTLYCPLPCFCRLFVLRVTSKMLLMNKLFTRVALNIVYYHTGTLKVVTVTLKHCKLHILGKATDKWINRKQWCIIDAAARAFPPGSPSTLTTCGVCQVSQHYIWTTNIGFHQLIYLKTSFLDVRNCGINASKTFSHFQTKAV